MAEPPLVPNPAAGPEIAALVRQFNETTSKLDASHEALRARVAELTVELAEKNRELERKNRLAVIGEMSACLAHEIRNPLGAIELYAGLLGRQLAGPQKELADKVLLAVRSLNDLVGGILTFTAQLHPERRRTSLPGLLEEAIALAARPIEERQVNVVREFAPDAEEAEIDAEMLRRVFVNLVQNGAQAMEAGGTLVVRTRREGGSVVVEVADPGHGIPAEILRRLFSPFFTTRSKGTGLGLAIALRIVEAHGGTIAARNNEAGPGATFTVVIPAEAAE